MRIVGSNYHIGMAALSEYQQTYGRFSCTYRIVIRFRTPKQQEDILKRLKRGEIDMIVGTHRLVSKDVQFHNLGLLIVDEEQRFGVAQKGAFERQL